jgi:hypothetical protein
VRLARTRPAGRRLIRAAALTAILAASAGCAADRPTETIQVDWQIEPAAPTLQRPARTRVTLTDEVGRPVTAVRLQIEGHMSHPGMAPVVAPAVESRPGVYEADIRFTMAGPWTLVASGATADGRRLTHTFDVPDVAP